MFVTRSSSPHHSHSPGGNKLAMSNPINALWSLLSLMVGGMATFAFMQPFWVLEPRRPDCLGVYSYCVKDLRSLDRDRQLCGIYGGYFALANLPSQAWRACCLLFASGSILHILCGVSSLATLCCRHEWGKRLATYTGGLQALAVLMSITGLLVFPAGFSSPFVRHYCRTSSAYRTGICEMGWGFLLAVMATALSLFCPVLAQFYDVHVCERRYHLAASVIPPIEDFPSPPLLHHHQAASVSNITGFGSQVGSCTVVMPTSAGGVSNMAATMVDGDHGQSQFARDFYRIDIPPGYSAYSSH